MPFEGLGRAAALILLRATARYSVHRRAASTITGCAKNHLPMANGLGRSWGVSPEPSLVLLGFADEWGFQSLDAWVARGPLASAQRHAEPSQAIAAPGAAALISLSGGR